MRVIGFGLSGARSHDADSLACPASGLMCAGHVRLAVRASARSVARAPPQNGSLVAAFGPRLGEALHTVARGHGSARVLSRM